MVMDARGPDGGFTEAPLGPVGAFGMLRESAVLLLGGGGP